MSHQWAFANENITGKLIFQMEQMLTEIGVLVSFTEIFDFQKVKQFSKLVLLSHYD
jgi:hypothetical protein